MSDDHSFLLNPEHIVLIQIECDNFTSSNHILYDNVVIYLTNGESIVVARYESVDDAKNMMKNIADTIRKQT